MQNISIENACAFTGHRPTRFSFGYDEQNPACNKLKQRLRCEIERVIHEDNVSVFYSGMALGVDMWAAELVLALKEMYPQLQLIAAIPCETQASRWSPAYQKRYQDILSHCDGIVTVSKTYTQGCMLKRDRYMVENAKHLIAVYDGSGKGGTAYTVKYAQSLNRNITLINPDLPH